jgi:uncharacterized delta-60 repeat protein
LIQSSRKPNSRRFVAVAAGVLALSVVFLAPTSALASPGGPDLSFGDASVARTGVAATPTQVAVDGVGRIVVAFSVPRGDGAGVLRLLPDGSLDPTFSGDGVEYIPHMTTIEAIAVDSNDRVTFAGWFYDQIGDITETVVARLTTSGEPDTGFANGGRSFPGEVLIPGMEATPEGEVILATVDPAVIYSADGGPTDEDLVLRGLTSRGVVDHHFGVHGVLKIDMGAGTARSQVLSLAPTNDGEAAALGSYRPSGSNADRRVVAKVTPSGKVDTSLNGGGAFPSGVVQLDPNWGFLNHIAVDGSGRMVVAGNAPGGVGVGRLTPAGSPDGSFGSAGHLTLAHEGFSVVVGVDVEPSGASIVSGISQVGDTYHRSWIDRIDATGSLDTDFADSGELSSLDHGLGQATLDERGRILATSYTNVSPAGVTVQRFEGGASSGDGESGGGDGESGGGDEQSGGVASELAASPGIDVQQVIAPKKWRKLIRPGVRVLAGCDSDCEVDVTVTVLQKVADAMGIPSTVIARGRGHSAAGAHGWVNATAPRKIRDELRSYSGHGRLHVSVTASTPS